MGSRGEFFFFFFFHWNGGITVRIALAVWVSMSPRVPVSVSGLRDWEMQTDHPGHPERVQIHW